MTRFDSPDWSISAARTGPSHRLRGGAEGCGSPGSSLSLASPLPASARTSRPFSLKASDFYHERLSFYGDLRGRTALEVEFAPDSPGCSRGHHGDPRRNRPPPAAIRASASFAVTRRSRRRRSQASLERSLSRSGRSSTELSPFTASFPAPPRGNQEGRRLCPSR